MDETQPLLGDSHRPPPSASDHDSPSKYIVTFDPSGDIDDPQQWPKKYRWTVVALLAFMAFTVSFTCVSIVPVAPMIIHDLSPYDPNAKSTSILFITIWELGEAAGPILIAPLSETFGRWVVFNVCNTLFLVGVLLTMLSPSAGVLIFARFATGCAVASNVLNPAVIADLFPSRERGQAMSVVMLTPLVGAAVGPVVAGAIAESLGWRWIMGVSAVLVGGCEVAFALGLRETFAVVILERRAERLRRDTGDARWRSVYEGAEGKKAPSLLVVMVRPILTLFRSWVLLAISLWGGLVFSFFYIAATTLADILHEIYDFTPAQTGVAFLSFSLGSGLGLILCNLLVDRVYVLLSTRHARKTGLHKLATEERSSHNADENYPEGRLPLAIAGAFILPPSVALYGLAPAYQLPVSVILVSVVAIGVALDLCILPIMTYVTDVFELYSASALTGMLITRCLMGTLLPLAVTPLVDALGLAGCFGALAGVVGVLAIVPVAIMIWGPRARGEKVE